MAAAGAGDSETGACDLERVGVEGGRTGWWEPRTPVLRGDGPGPRV